VNDINADWADDQDNLFGSVGVIEWCTVSYVNNKNRQGYTETEHFNIERQQISIFVHGVINAVLKNYNLIN